MPKQIDYKALYNEQVKLNKKLKLQGTFSVTDACYMVNHFGALISETPIDLGQEGYLLLTEEEQSDIMGNC